MDAEKGDQIAAAPSRFQQMMAGKTGLRRYIGPKRLLALILCVALFIIARRLNDDGVLTPDALRQLVETRPLLSGLAFIVFYAVTVLTALPSLPFNLAAGVFWGPWAGGAIATIGATLGAAAAFLASRFMLGQPLARRYDQRFVAWLQAEFSAKGWRFIAFLRLNPIFPTGPLNYVLGLTGISFSTYLWATALFLLPPSIAVAWVGDAMGTFVADGDVNAVIRLIVAGSAGVSLLVALRYLAKHWSRGAASPQAGTDQPPPMFMSGDTPGDTSAR